MARFGAHAFIWRSEWTSAAARAVIEGAAAAGRDFVEIPLLRPAAFDAAAARSLLDAHGLAATCSLGLPTDAALPDDPAGAERFLRRAVDGDLVMESFVAVNAGIARATCMWRDVVEDPDRLVVDGLAFLRAAARRDRRVIRSRPPRSAPRAPPAP